MQQMRLGAERSERRWLKDPDGDHWTHGRFVKDGVGQVYNRKLNDFLALGETPDWAARRLDKQPLQELLTLRRAYRSERRTGPAGADGANLLKEVCRKFGDDAPRLVYADMLTGLGDPRGEFIVLQIHASQGTSDKASRARMRELWKAHSAEWTWTIRKAIRLRKADFERGFYTTAKLVKGDLKTQQAVVGAVEWATVRSVQMESAGLVTILLDPAFKALRNIDGLGPLASVRTLAAYHPNLHHLGFRDRFALGKVPTEGPGLTRLRTLDLPPRYWPHIPWLTSELAKPLRVLRLRRNNPTSENTVSQALAECIVEARKTLELAKRTEIHLDAGIATAEVHLRLQTGSLQIAARLLGVLELQRAMLNAEPPAHVVSLQTEVKEAGARFPDAKIRGG